MKIDVEVNRSEEWVIAQRIARGENVPDRIVVPVEVSELSELSRRTIISSWYLKQYPQSFSHVSFNSSYEIGNHGYGRRTINIDSDSPSASEINAAIEAAIASVEAKRVEWQANVAEAETRKEKEAAEMARARELLGATIKSLEDRLEDMTSKRTTLATFLAHVPSDAKRGTLKAVADCAAERERLQREVEDASPVIIFHSEDDDEEDE